MRGIGTAAALCEGGAGKGSNRVRRGDVAILPFEIQQRLRRRCLLQVQCFHFANHDQVITGDVFGVNVAIQPMQAAGDDRVAQR